MLRNIRLSRGLTEEEAARELGVIKSTYHRWETGVNGCRPRHVPAIAAWSGLPVEYVVEHYTRAGKRRAV